MSGPIKTNLRMVVFPLWYFVNIFYYLKISVNKISMYNFLFIVISHWLLFFFTGDNYILSFISANAAIFGFLAFNLFSQLNINEYSNGDLIFLNSFFIRSIATFSAIIFQYLFAGAPYIILSSLKLNGIIFSNNIELSWNIIQKLIAVLLFLQWFVFAHIDKFMIFEKFPREEKSFWPTKLKRKDKFIIIFMPIVCAAGWGLLKSENLFFF